LKRLTRDGELRESFGRYALIGEAVRGGTLSLMTKGFAARVNLAIDGEAIPAGGHAPQIRAARWWRPFAGAAVAAGVAAVAVVALQQRAVAPGVRPGAAVTAQRMAQGMAVPAQSNLLLAQNVVLAPGGALQTPREPLVYTVPPASPAAPAAMAPARLTNYVFAHSRYSSGLDQRGVMADLLIEAEEQQPAAHATAAPVAP
jgi:negative regulator of sigma E activity